VVIQLSFFLLFQRGYSTFFLLSLFQHGYSTFFLSFFQHWLFNDKINYKNIAPIKLKLGSSSNPTHQMLSKFAQRFPRKGNRTTKKQW